MQQSFNSLKGVKRNGPTTVLVSKRRQACCCKDTWYHLLIGYCCVTTKWRTDVVFGKLTLCPSYHFSVSAPTKWGAEGQSVTRADQGYC